MKKVNNIKFLLSFAVIFGLASCDKGFEKLNQNEYSATNLDAGFLFTGAERGLSVGGYDNSEQTITQQVINGFATGTPGFNVNNDNDTYNPLRWNQCFGTIKTLTQIMSLVKSDPARNNLYQMSRILKAYQFMILVDTYGDVPYSEAGFGYLNNIIYPKYDKQVDIYNDLYKELKEASAALNVAGDAVPQDFFYGTGRTSTAAAQIPRWKKLGYSLMLRLGMRYTKIDPGASGKAKTIVTDAYNGGLMTAITDNLLIGYNGTVDANPLYAGLRGNSPHFYYIGAPPFADQMRTTLDPRSKYMIATYTAPSDINVAPADVNPANQYGLPIGVGFTFNSSNPAFRGNAAVGTGYKLSQLNFSSYNSATAPIYFVTYAQTQLLLAEAAFRGYLTGLPGALTTAAYYDSGIRESFKEIATFPGATAITPTEITNYTGQAAVALTPGTELAKINIQYWIESLNNGAESYANWRRSGFPVLPLNPLGSPPTSGTIRRFPYPNNEQSANPSNYASAVASMGGDDLNQRVFWDIP